MLLTAGPVDSPTDGDPVADGGAAADPPATAPQPGDPGFIGPLPPEGATPWNPKYPPDFVTPGEQPQPTPDPPITGPWVTEEWEEGLGESGGEGGIGNWPGYGPPTWNPTGPPSGIDPGFFIETPWWEQDPPSWWEAPTDPDGGF